MSCAGTSSMHVTHMTASAPSASAAEDDDDEADADEADDASLPLLATAVAVARRRSNCGGVAKVRGGRDAASDPSADHECARGGEKGDTDIIIGDEADTGSSERRGVDEASVEDGDDADAKVSGCGGGRPADFHRRSRAVASVSAAKTASESHSAKISRRSDSI